MQKAKQMMERISGAELVNMAVMAQVMSAIVSHVDSHSTSHWDGARNIDVEWPADAVYMAEYSLTAWPTSATRHYRFFSNARDLQAWYSRMLEWARFEDNRFELDALHLWDLGPSLINYGDWRAHLVA